jgi:hypothetical protein
MSRCLTVVGAGGPGGEGNGVGFGGFHRAQAAGGERHPESERLVRPARSLTWTRPAGSRSWSSCATNKPRSAVDDLDTTRFDALTRTTY